MRKGSLLTLLILLGFAIGILVGERYLFDPVNPVDEHHWTRQVGELILVRPLMMIGMPLILVSVIVGVASIGNPIKVGLIAGASMLLFAFTLLIAAILGVVLASAYSPAALPNEVQDQLRRSTAHQFDMNSEVAQHVDAIEQSPQSHVGLAWVDTLSHALPINVIDEMNKNRPLGVLVFALLLGLGLGVGGERTAPALRMLEALVDAFLRVARWLAWLAPIGVMFLAAFAVGRIGLRELAGPLARYTTILIAGLAIHGFLVLPFLMLLLARQNPFVFLWQVRNALLVALGTSSSLAAMPIAINAGIHEGGCSARVTRCVLPLAAAVNRNGTVLFQAVAVMFLFPLYGIHLGFGEVVIVVVTSVLASVAAAGLPSAGLATLVIVITAVNTSLAGRGIEPLPMTAIGVIISIDRVLDMCRSAINTWGDLVAAKIISALDNTQANVDTELKSLPH